MAFPYFDICHCSGKSKYRKATKTTEETRTNTKYGWSWRLGPNVRSQALVNALTSTRLLEVVVHMRRVPKYYVLNRCIVAAIGSASASANSVESDLDCTSWSTFDRVTPTSQKPCQHNNKINFIYSVTLREIILIMDFNRTEYYFSIHQFRLIKCSFCTHSTTPYIYWRQQKTPHSLSLIS